MPTQRQEKIGRLLQKDLGDIFQKESRTLFGGAFITVTVVRVTSDLGLAKVYLSLFPPNNREEVLQTVKEHTKHIRKELGNRIRNQVRIIPALAFYIDDTLDYAENIDRLLKE